MRIPTWALFRTTKDLYIEGHGSIQEEGQYNRRSEQGKEEESKVQSSQEEEEDQAKKEKKKASNKFFKSDVVASLASDKNMWDAMMKNERVLEFYKNQESAFPPKTILEPEESAANGNAEESVDSSETSESGLPDWVNNIKLKVSEIVSNISDWFQDFMGPSTGASGTKASTHIDSPAEFAIGASFLALAVAAILVVLVKRGG